MGKVQMNKYNDPIDLTPDQVLQIFGENSQEYKNCNRIFYSLSVCEGADKGAFWLNEFDGNQSGVRVIALGDKIIEKMIEFYSEDETEEEDFEPPYITKRQQALIDSGHNWNDFF